MEMLAIKILNKKDDTLSVSRGEDFVDLVYSGEYQEGDRIVLETSGKGMFVNLQFDDVVGPSLCYVTGNVSFVVPHGEKKISYSPLAFTGNKHHLYAKIARPEEIYNRRNVALNVWDQHGETNCYPHAVANVETRGEAVFAARNAIDGICANQSHGEWPYESWGINRQDDAEMTVDFGVDVDVDEIVLYTRADFPHDNWWKQVTLTFSDGSSVDFEMEKSALPHVCPIEKKGIRWVKLEKLIKADDPSPFPALSQIEVYGKIVQK